MEDSRFNHTRESSGGPEVFCFHHAGGSSMYYADMKQYVDSSIGIHPYDMEGRGRRIRDELPATMEAAAETAASAVDAAAGDSPFYLMGHSMGGVLAYLTAYLLEKGYGRRARGLFLTSSVPDLGVENSFGGIRMTGLDDDTFCDALMRFGLLDARIMAVKQFRSLFLPLIRADFRLIESFYPSQDMKVSCPLLVMGGEDDPIVDTSRLPQWTSYTTAETEIMTFPGGHFFMKDLKERIYGIIEDRILSGGYGL